MTHTDFDDTTLAYLTDAVRAFALERNWSRFHSPKNLAAALTVEAAELLELFQWQTPEEEREPLSDDVLAATKAELADIAIYALNLCATLNINLGQAILQKLAVNAERYPPSAEGGSWSRRSRD